MISQKAQISLEYILIAFAIISVLSMLSYQIINIYNKNIDAIDNKKLKNLKQDLEESLKLSESMPNFYKEIEINPEKFWKIHKINNKLILENKTKEYIITSNIDIKIMDIDLSNINKIILNKKQDILTITFEEKQ